MVVSSVVGRYYFIIVTTIMVKNSLLVLFLSAVVVFANANDVSSLSSPSGLLVLLLYEQFPSLDSTLTSSSLSPF